MGSIWAKDHLASCPASGRLEDMGQRGLKVHFAGEQSCVRLGGTLPVIGHVGWWPLYFVAVYDTKVECGLFAWEVVMLCLCFYLAGRLHEEP